MLELLIVKTFNEVLNFEGSNKMEQQCCFVKTNNGNSGNVRVNTCAVHILCMIPICSDGIVNGV